MNPKSFNRSNPSILNFTEIWKRLNSLNSLTNGTNIINQNESAQVADFWIDGEAKSESVFTQEISSGHSWDSPLNLIIKPTVSRAGDTFFTSSGKVGIGRPTTLSRLHVFGSGNQFAISQDDTSATPGELNTPVATMSMRILTNGSVGHTISTATGTLPSFVYSHVVAAPTLRVNTLFTPTSSADATGTVGDIARDDDYIYVKTNSGWKRSALSAF